MGAAVSGSKAYFGGGCLNSGSSNVIDSFDPASGSWKQLGVTLSAPRCYLTATASSSYILFAGGYFDGVSSSVVDILNGNLLTTFISSLSSPRYGIASVSLKDQIALFAGGYNSAGNSVSSLVDVYNYTSNMWSTTSLTVARHWGTAVASDSKSFIAGGIDASMILSYSTVDIYNMDTKSWTSTSLSVSRGYLTSIKVGIYTVFAGGYTGSANSAVVDIYDTVKSSWTSSLLSIARLYLSAASYGCKAIFAGGGAYGGTAYYNQVDIYDFSTFTWTTSLITLSTAVDQLSAVTIGSLMIFVGGFQSGTAKNVVNYLSFACTVTGTLFLL